MSDLDNAPATGQLRRGPNLRTSNKGDVGDSIATKVVTETEVRYRIREQEVPTPGWVIVAIRPDGSEEQLIGVFRERRFAELWIEGRSDETRHC